MEFLSLTSIEDAYKAIYHQFFVKSPKILKTEKINLEDALSRVCAADYYSDADIPGFERSTVDGYAVLAADTFGASDSVPCFLNIVYEAEMGENHDIKIKSGEAVAVPTGGMLPENADAVMMIEFTERLDSETVAVYKAVAPNTNVIHKADDAKSGAALIKRGKRITELDIGILAAAGIWEVEVYAPLTCFILSTGDELAEINQALVKGRIREVNSYTIGAALKRRGVKVIGRKIVGDNFEAIKQAIMDGLEQSDFLIMSGGSSVGEKDYTFAAVNSIEPDSVFLHGLSVKPGKPTIIGNVSGKPVFGLPGQTVSAFIIYKAVVEYYLNLLTGEQPKPPIKAILTDNVHSSPGKHSYQTVHLRYETDDIYAEPIYGKSGLISQLLRADGVFGIPENSEGLLKGRRVDVVLLD